MVKRNRAVIYCALIGILLLSFLRVAEAQTRTVASGPIRDPRGPAELTVCSQNLENYGRLPEYLNRVKGSTPEDFARKEAALVTRFIRARCDVIAIQELLGRDEERALEAAQQLATALRKKTNRFFDVKIGATNDRWTRVGFLVAKDRARILNSVSYARAELPPISENQRVRLFTRGPLELQIEVKGKDGTTSRRVALVTFHFKSKRGGQGDPARLEWESYRMEMAEALRRIVLNRYRDSFTYGGVPLVLLGDRNSNLDVASAKILEGVVHLNDFQDKGDCRLSKRGVPLCTAQAKTSQELFSVLTLDPQIGKKTGTHAYRGTYSWLDDILMPQPSLPFAREHYAEEGDFASGVVYTPENASDHALIWVRLNW